ncbi:hypothetical protein SS50377_26409 [Spironucleus salmonicida]|nr:hypothetical protein SS50377_26409 [Spironucleus salmonicida]
MDNEQYKTELLAQTQLINSLTEKIDGCDFQMKEAQQIQETLLQKEIVQNSSILEKLLKKQNADLSKQTSEEKLNQ